MSAGRSRSSVTMAVRLRFWRLALIAVLSFTFLLLVQTTRSRAGLATTTTTKKRIWEKERKLQGGGVTSVTSAAPLHPFSFKALSDRTSAYTLAESVSARVVRSFRRREHRDYWIDDDDDDDDDDREEMEEDRWDGDSNDEERGDKQWRASTTFSPAGVTTTRTVSVVPPTMTAWRDLSLGAPILPSQQIPASSAPSLLSPPPVDMQSPVPVADPPMSPKRAAILASQLAMARQQAREAASFPVQLQATGVSWTMPTNADAFLPGQEVQVVWTESPATPWPLHFRLCALQGPDDMQKWSTGLTTPSCGPQIDANAVHAQQSRGLVTFTAPRVGEARAFFVILDSGLVQSFGRKRGLNDMLVSPPFVLAPKGTDLRSSDPDPSVPASPQQDETLAHPEADAHRPFSWWFVAVPLAVILVVMLLVIVVLVHRSGRKSAQKDNAMKISCASARVIEDLEADRRWWHSSLPATTMIQVPQPVTSLTGDDRELGVAWRRRSRPGVYYQQSPLSSHSPKSFTIPQRARQHWKSPSFASSTPCLTAPLYLSPNIGQTPARHHSTRSRRSETESYHSVRYADSDDNDIVEEKPSSERFIPYARAAEKSLPALPAPVHSPSSPELRTSSPLPVPQMLLPRSASFSSAGPRIDITDMGSLSLPNPHSSVNGS